MMMESMSGGYGGHRNSNAKGGSTFFIAVPLRDDVEVDVVHDDDHTTMSVELEQLDKGALRVLKDGERVEKDDQESKTKSKTRAAVRGKEPGTTLEMSTTTATATTTTTRGKYRLLLVEDMPLNRALIRLWLLHEFPNLHVVDASNGKEALKELNMACQAEAPFDIVLMDISMPVMDGFSCLDEMTLLYGNNRPPTIAITTGVMYENPARKQLGGTAGAKFDQWWDKTDQSALMRGMKALMIEIEK